MLEELLDDQEDIGDINLSSRPMREEGRRQRDREALEREVRRPVCLQSIYEAVKANNCCLAGGAPQSGQRRTRAGAEGVCKAVRSCPRRYCCRSAWRRAP